MRLAGRAGVPNYGDYTLRELIWFAEGAQERDWAAASQICAVVANVRSGANPKPYDAADFNPTLHRDE